MFIVGKNQEMFLILWRKQQYIKCG